MANTTAFPIAKTTVLTVLLTLAPMASAFAQEAPPTGTSTEVTTETPAQAEAPVETPAETPAEPVNPNAGHAYVCVNASRGGLSLEIPGIGEDGKISGSLRLFKLARTIRQVPAERIEDYVNDGETISMKGLDRNGNAEIVVNTYENDGSIMPKGRVVQAKFKDIGMIAFACRLKNASN